MSFGWAYFWPAFAAGVVIGLVGGLVGYRRRPKQFRYFAIAALVAIAAAALWHGPMGAADKFETEVNRTAKLTLEVYEMTGVEARLQRSPLSRTIALSGSADDFQREELVRVLSTVSGVSGATWSASKRGLPLLLEGMLIALLGYFAGLFIAYLVDLHRRYNSQWTW